MVSVVIPVRNRPRLIEEAVASALAQAWRPLEIIVVDDASDDDTPRVLERLREAHPEVIRLHRHTERGGPGRARETGRGLVQGAYVQYLDSDDLLLEGKFERQAAVLGDGTQPGIAYGVTVLGRRDGSWETAPRKRTGQAYARLFPELLVGRLWDTATPLWTRATVDAVGPWLGAGHDEDLEYEARAAALGTPLVHVPGRVSVHRRHDGHAQGGDRTHLERFWRDRERAHRSVVDSARAVDPRTPERQHYARALFLFARQAGADGQPAVAASLLRLAARMDAGVRPWGRRVYGLAARVVGPSAMGRWSARRDRRRDAEAP